jgi:DNA invertase Pin-like site-specific DNA recombinase
MRIGSARASIPEQSCTLQRDALEQSGCVKVFAEVASGAKAARPALAAALVYLRAGDTLVVWRLDRLGRLLGQLMVLMQTLQSRQIGFHSLVEAIDTTTATGQFFFQITGLLRS